MKKLAFLIFLFFFSASVFANESCADLFVEINSRITHTVLELASIYRNNTDRFVFHKDIELNLSDSPIYKGLNLKKINNLGSVNAGIFEFTDPHYGTSVLKIYKFPENKIEELRSFSKSTYRSSKQTLEIISYIRGNLLSQNFGGPKLYDSGFLKDKDGDVYFYIQMERIFPDIKFFSVKEIAWRHTKNRELVRLLRKYPEIIENLEKMQVELEGWNIVPFDPDIAIAKDGRIRWIDTDYWELGTPEQTRLAMFEIIDLLKEMKKGSIFSIY